MNQTFATNKHWRNIGIFILLLLSVLFVFIFTKVHRSKQACQKALLAAIKEENIPLSFENGRMHLDETTFLYFENGVLWAEEMDKKTDTAYTSFIDPSVETINGVTLIYEYPFVEFYSYYESSFIKREANIPISYVTASPLGRYAVVNDPDCKVNIYEKDGTLIFSLDSSLPIADIAFSSDQKHLFLAKISLTTSNTYWLESYNVDKGKQTTSQVISMKGIPHCCSYKHGWFVWNETDAYYITKWGKAKVLNKIT